MSIFQPSTAMQKKITSIVILHSFTVLRVRKKEIKVTVKLGDEYPHPDDFDHYIAWVQLWNGESNLAQATFVAGALGNQAGHVEVDFFIVPTRNLKLTAMAFCTKHGLWQSDEVVVEVTE